MGAILAKRPRTASCRAGTSAPCRRGASVAARLSAARQIAASERITIGTFLAGTDFTFFRSPFSAVSTPMFAIEAHFARFFSLYRSLSASFQILRIYTVYTTCAPCFRCSSQFCRFLQTEEADVCNQVNVYRMLSLWDCILLDSLMQVKITSSDIEFQMSFSKTLLRRCVECNAM